MRSSSSSTGGTRARGRSSDSGRRARSWLELRAALSGVFGTDLPASAFDESQPIDDAESTLRLLRALLQGRHLEINTRLHSDELAKVLRLHRNTISKVFQALAEEGYLHRRRGRPALVVAYSQVLPRRQTKRVSHTALAISQGYAIRTVGVRRKSCRVSELRRADVVADRLRVDRTAGVRVYSRIRELRAADGSWVPAIAESAYFVDSLPPRFYARLDDPQPVDSLHAVLREHGIDPVTGEYNVRIDRLPNSFLADWSASSGMTEADIRELRFLRFESTTHGGHRGPIEYSVAFLAENLFALSTADLTLAIRRAAPLEPASQPVAPEPPPRRSRARTRPRRS